MMTREEAIKELKELFKNCDTEGDHVDADNVLCRLLIQLGYDDVVEAYNKIHKWYA